MMCFSWCYCVFGQQLCCSGLHDRINSMVKCLLFIASVLQLKFDDMKKVLFWELPSLWLCLYLSLSPLIVYVPPFRLSLSLPLLSLCLFLPPTSLSLPLCLSVCSSFLSLSLPPSTHPLSQSHPGDPVACTVDGGFKIQELTLCACLHVSFSPLSAVCSRQDIVCVCLPSVCVCASPLSHHEVSLCSWQDVCVCLPSVCVCVCVCARPSVSSWGVPLQLTRCLCMSPLFLCVCARPLCLIMRCPSAVDKMSVYVSPHVCVCVCVSPLCVIALMWLCGCNASSYLHLCLILRWSCAVLRLILRWPCVLTVSMYVSPFFLCVCVSLLCVSSWCDLVQLTISMYISLPILCVLCFSSLYHCMWWLGVSPLICVSILWWPCAVDRMLSLHVSLPSSCVSPLLSLPVLTLCSWQYCQCMSHSPLHVWCVSPCCLFLCWPCVVDRILSVYVSLPSSCGVCLPAVSSCADPV